MISLYIGIAVLVLSALVVGVLLGIALAAWADEPDGQRIARKTCSARAPIVVRALELPD
jgi:hypothetical protein